MNRYVLNQRLVAFVFVLASSPVSAGPLDQLFNEISKAIVEDVSESRGSTSSTLVPPPQAGQNSPPEDFEHTIVTGLDCASQLGFQPSQQMRQECFEKHFAKCSEWINSLPINEDGEKEFKRITSYRAKCGKMSMNGEARYLALLSDKELQFEQYKNNKKRAECMSRLGTIPVLDGSTKLINELSNQCQPEYQEFKAMREKKLKDVSVIEGQARKKQYAPLIQQYSKAIPAPDSLLTSEIVVQWGGSLGIRLIKFIDMVQTHPRSKATYEMNGKSLIMRHRISDPVTRKTSSMNYVFTPDPTNSDGVFLVRIVGEKTTLGGLVKEQEEVPMKDIGTVFAVIVSAVAGD